MSLKLIPVEKESRDKVKKQKHFNPGNRMQKPRGDSKQEGAFLKNLCLRLVAFINRGSRFTYEQIDEVIAGLHRSILILQKKKQDILRKKPGNDRT